MFSINTIFYFPMFCYPNHPYMLPNPHFTHPDLFVFSKTQTSVDSFTSLPTSTQIDRKAEKQNDNNDLYHPTKNEEKNKDFMKKKFINKRLEKSIDSAEQAEKLKRKLANRPKTYQTQKKMYLSAKLDQIDGSSQGKRILRKRHKHRKRERVLHQSSSKHETEPIFVDGQQLKKLDHEENPNCFIMETSQKDRSEDFYNPQAEIPFPYEKTLEIHSEIERKRLSLLYRKIQTKPNSFQ